MHKNSQSVTDNLSTSRSSCRRNTYFAPFNLSWSNKTRAKEDSQSDKADYNITFKARKIPKTHKVPFMVYYSTKSLTSFNNTNQAKVTSYTWGRNQLSESSTNSQLKWDKEKSDYYSKPLKVKNSLSQNQNQIRFEVKSKKHDKENQQVTSGKRKPQRLSDYDLFEPLVDNTNIRTFDNREEKDLLSVCYN